MDDLTKFNSIVSFLWANADLLNGPFKKSEFQKIILPFTVLRRFDYALEATKSKVLETDKKLKDKGLENRHTQLCKASGYAFYNTSKFTYESLLRDDANLARNLRQYIHGFSPNVREIFEAFNFDDAIRDLEKAKLLFLLMERFNEKTKVDLRPSSLSNVGMGYVFEHLLRRFNEALNENPGEHFTPREVIRLMVDLIISFDSEISKGEGIAKTVYDCCCGTGGILSTSKEAILQRNPKAKVHIYGQEVNPQTWAIARSDMLILDPEGKDAENIKLGSTLSADSFGRMKFDYQLVNPPYGYEWSKDEKAVKEEATRGHGGRFGAGIPRISDGQMLFLQHLIARMNDPKDAQSYVGIIMNGSPLFSGGAGSGESEIRRWILENDWLEAIICLPNQIFYNTGIATYIWLLTNRKTPAHKGKVMLVDASGEEFWSKMSKNLGSKSREITAAHQQAILKLVKDRKEGPNVKIFDTTDFGYREIKVLRPLKLRFEVNAEALARLNEQAAFKKLASSKKKSPADRKNEEEESRTLQAKIRTALQTLSGKVYINRDKFSVALDGALEKAGLKLKAPVIKAILNATGERDDAAEVCHDSKGNPEPDTELTDTENVPLKKKIEEHFAREVAPHVPDAWIDLTHCDAKDGKVGRVGYEIPFNRHFHVFQPPRSLSVIDSDLKTSTDRILTLIEGLTQ
jgi:type I restriction enzyme M protein